jgi:ATP/maltotriose-dependent transcriptional regulator MalT
VLRQTARALANLTGNAVVFGYDHRAIALIGDLRDLCARTGTQTYDCMCQLYQLTLCWHGGDWAGLQDRLTALAAQYPDMNKVNAAVRLISGNLFAAQGEWRHAAELFSQVIEETDNSEPSLGCSATAGLARVRLAQGDPQAAWDLARPAVAALHTIGLWLQSSGLLPVAVKAALACAGQDAAAQLTEQYETELMGKSVPAHRTDLAVCRGLLAQAAGKDSQAADEFTRAAEMFREIGRPHPAALATERAARIAGSPEAARELAQAAEILAGLGATSDASRCQQALRELGQPRTPSPRGRRGYGDALSPREQEIAALIATGASNKDIAHALFLSQRTVEHHVARTLKKLGAAGREAVRDALAQRKNN